MRLWSHLRSRARRLGVTHLTTVEVDYAGCFVVRRLDDDSLELAWYEKIETVLTDRGAVWSQQRMSGPCIDRLRITVDSVPHGAMSGLTIRYPVTLGAERGTLRATAPGVVHELASGHLRDLDSRETRRR